MPDIATVGAILSSIKTATEITKFLRSSDSPLEKSELKLKLADLIEALADARIELVTVQETLAEKDKKIADLEEAFETQDEIIQRSDAYYTKGDYGEAIGKPYCLRCWESEHKKKQLVSSPKDHRTKVCTSCGHQYDNMRTPEIFPKPVDAQ